MSRHNHYVGVALVGVMLLVAAACGQKPGVAEQGIPVGALGSSQAVGEVKCDPETGECVDEAGNLIDPNTGEIIGRAGEGGGTGGLTALGGGGSSGSGSTGTGDSSSTGSDTSTDTGGDGPSSTGTAGPAPRGGTSTGVSGKTIKIGLHAPTTGAAPVPQDSFRKGTNLYWQWLRRTGQKINGRNVVAVFRNDRYNPSHAVSMCREMVQEEKVFLLVGLAGTDQIQACARYAASVGVPYISAGVTEIGLTSLDNYFTMWMSYKMQGPLLADMLIDDLGARGEKNGMIRFNTPLFQDAHDSWVSAMRSRGASVSFDRAIQKSCNQTEVTQVATQIATQRIKNVYVLTSPTCWLQIASATRNQGYRPQWTGIGLSMAIDTVANVGCRNNRSIDNARFLNPFPAFINSARYDPNFRRAGGTDDIQFGLWGASKVVAGLLKRPGRNLTRERFIYYAERTGGLSTGVYPPVGYSPGDHFAGNAMHMNRVDCEQNRWVTATKYDFKSNF
jgi:branched-chain amino acid transport system substrate-binding protein